MLGWGFSGLLLRSQLGSFSIGVPSLRLEKDERLILGQVCIYSWKRRALCYAVLGCVRNLRPNTLWGLFWETKYGRFTTLNIAKCEHFTLLVRPLQFLVISALGRLGNVQGFTLMIIWDPCSKTCGGSDVQKCMLVCVGLLPINSTTRDSVCPGSNFEKRASE